jgi:altronate dehydratase
MKLACKSESNPDRALELEEHMDIDITELLAKAADAGYSEEEAITAILNVAKYQSYVHGRLPHSSDDPDQAL